MSYKHSSIVKHGLILPVFLAEHKDQPPDGFITGGEWGATWCKEEVQNQDHNKQQSQLTFSEVAQGQIFKGINKSC